jgi:hypothetical protein
VALFIGTALATLDWDVTHLFFGFQFLTDGFYVVYEWVLDIFGLLLVVGLGMAIYRRYVLRPARLQNPRTALIIDDAYILTMLVLIAISGYLTEGLRIAVTQPAWAAWSPVGNAIASLFLAAGDPTNQGLHLAIWSFHILTSFVLIASLPFTKLFHILAVPTNIFFRVPRRYSTPCFPSGGGEEWSSSPGNSSGFQVLPLRPLPGCCPANVSASISPSEP